MYAECQFFFQMFKAFFLALLLACTVSAKPQQQHCMGELNDKLAVVGLDKVAILNQIMIISNKRK